MDAVQRCAYCRTHPVEHKWRPFCSERCKLLDLAKWLDGDYRVPGERTGIRDQESGIRDQEPGIGDQESEIGIEGSAAGDRPSAGNRKPGDGGL